MKIEQIEALTKDIVRSHTEPGNSEIQTNVLMRCMQLLLLDEMANEVHLFCNTTLEPIAGHALIMFSFPGKKNRQSQLIEERMTRSLALCTACVRCFHKSLSQMRQRFIMVRKIPVPQVNQFLSIISDWLLPRLEGEIANSHPNVAAVVEVLSNPTLCRQSATLRKAVALVFPDSPPYFLPALIYYLVEGTDEEYAYAKKAIVSLQSEPQTLDPQVIDEFNYHFYRIQNAKYFTPALCIRFWSMFNDLCQIFTAEELQQLLKPAELEEMSSFTQIRLFPLIRVLFNTLMASLNEPVPILLQVLHTLIVLYGQDFWKVADGCHFTNILDTVLVNPNYMAMLHQASRKEDNSQEKLVEWILVFVDSLSGSQRQAAAIKLSEFLVQRENADDKILSVDSATLLLKCFDVEALNASNANLLKMRDARVAVNKHSDYFVKLARKCAAEDSPNNALELVAISMRYDILVASYNSSLLEKKESPVLTDSDPALWVSLLKVPVSHISVTSRILADLSDTASIVVFKEKKNQAISREMDAALKIHNRETEKLCANISSVLDKIALADPDQLKAVLTQDSCMSSLWSCMFCPQINQSALNILYQVFDAEGRYEAIAGILGQALKPTLKAIIRSLDSITNLKVFEPCPKAIRILMDVVKALTDPLSGILSTQVGGLDCKEEIQILWKSSWLLLVMIYETTLTWAGLYHLDDLIEFTRDTLDLSHLLLDSFRTFLDAILDQNVNIPLFDVFMKAFNHVIVWLRLGDLSLLNSCVNLVFKGFDLAKDLNVSVDKEFIITFAKYGAKAKKFNNKLSEQQRLEILAKASEFDKNLVQYVIEEARKQRAGNRVPPAQMLTQSNYQEPGHVKIGATYAYQSLKAKQPKQLTLSRFGVVTHDPPVAPAPPKPFKSNNLEAIRSELASSRVPSKAPINPAPPRPAGFNTKGNTIVGRSLNAIRHKKAESDSSEDEEEDVDVSDLFFDSKKKTKIVELDMNGRPVAKLAAATKVNQERREEERMRLRLNVNLKPLYSTILKWNYNSNSEFPSDERDIYHPIKESYSDAKEYVRLIEPLLMLECWQGIQSSRQTGQEQPFELLVGSRTTCDGFFDVYASIKKAELQARKVGDSDLLVLGYVADQKFGSTHEIARHLKQQGTQTCLAKVRDIKYANADYCDITIRVYPQGSMMGLLTPKSIIVAMKVMQMVTVEREYSSLKGLPYYDLCDDILGARPTKPAFIADSEAESMCKLYNLNISQAKAIMGSHASEGFSLIQGPPGTGKTKTILGIVGHFLSSVQKENTIQVPSSSLNNPASGKGVEEKSGPKVLICAPSNAAVDELVLRIRNGVVNSKGEPITPKVVRLGRGDAMNAAVRDLSLEELMDRQLKARNTDASIDPSIRAEHNKCIAERDQIREKLKNGELPDNEVIALETQLRDINKRRSELGKRLDQQRENASIAYRTREIERRQLQAKILSEAQIICSTLSGSAHDFLASMSMKFDQVIIDEACQCVELSAMIPLRYGCKRCIMVGDPNQLPPTVLSQKAASFRYEESLFVRMQRNNPESVYLLDVQYRMHPDISKFPSAEFYKSRLTDGEGMLVKNERPWHQQFPLTPYRFFDIVSRHQQNEKSKSFFNNQEARVALELVEKLIEILPHNQFKGRIGIISPYKEQIRALKDIVQKRFGNTILYEIDFNTVDGFQGQEKEIIIMSCVRASETGSVGFLSDIRRMNVALTRARTTLWILGNKNSLKRDKVWSKLIADAEARSFVTRAEPGFLKRINRPNSSQIEDLSNSTAMQPKKRKSENMQSVRDEPQTAQLERKHESAIPEYSAPQAKKSLIAEDLSKESSSKKHKPHKTGVYIHNPSKPSVSTNGYTSPAGSEQNVAPPPSTATATPQAHSSIQQNTNPTPQASKSGYYPLPKKPSSIFIQKRGKMNRPPGTRPPGPRPPQ